MKAILWLAATMLAVFSLGGCCVMSVAYPVAETIDNSVTATKSGKACQTALVGVIYSGDASVDAAKSAGDITRVHNVDGHLTSILTYPNLAVEIALDPNESPPFSLYYEKCTIVHGE